MFLIMKLCFDHGYVNLIILWYLRLSLLSTFIEMNPMFEV